MKDLKDIINIDTYDIVHEMETYRGKISKDIDKVIDYQTQRNMTTIIRKHASKFDKLIDDDFNYARIDFGDYNHLNINQALYKQMSTLIIQESLYFKNITPDNLKTIMDDSDLKFSEVFFYELPEGFKFV